LALGLFSDRLFQAKRGLAVSHNVIGNFRRSENLGAD
jgi:hypothetical protein